MELQNSSTRRKYSRNSPNVRSITSWPCALTENPPRDNSTAAEKSVEFASPVQKDEYTDGRLPWDWKSKYPPEARAILKFEAFVLLVILIVSLVISGLFLSLASQSFDIPLYVVGQAPLLLHIDCRLLMIFFVGFVGGTTFSIKWLIHSAAKGKWHLDRRYWRFFVPALGGVYACVVLTLFDAGLIGGQPPDKPRPIALVAAFAFLVGYFSDGVSGLLSNIANAVFGTLEKK